MRPYTATATDLARQQGNRDTRKRKRMHLKSMLDAGQLPLKYPEAEKPPHQAYLAVYEQNKDALP